MEYKEFDSKMSEMLSKIGEEKSNLVLDDVAYFLTDYKNREEELLKKNDEIKKLETSITNLQRINGNLLLQIPAIKENKKEDENKKYKIHSMKDAFDEFGNFKR